jgi:meso-butanediol dehydrogenase/(S,S)-butanediol dehydrogenase/diacetyl reductase
MKRIVVTGGNSGMGRETAELFLRQGDRVVFTSRSTDKAQAMLEDNREAVEQGNLFFCQCDSSKWSEVVQLAAFTQEKLGGCDVLVNCAAIFVGGQVHETSEEDFSLILDIDVKGVFLTCKAFLPQMLEQGSGCLINISSLAGIRGNYNAAAYCAAKGAVNNLTRAMALDYGTRGIRANTVCPSATSTDMFLVGSTREVIDSFYKQNPMGRISSPGEIARLIAFLASDDAAFINGQCISVDGGLSAWSGEPRQDKTEQRR